MSIDEIMLEIAKLDDSEIMDLWDKLDDAIEDRGLWEDEKDLEEGTDEGEDIEKEVDSDFDDDEEDDEDLDGDGEFPEGVQV